MINNFEILTDYKQLIINRIVRGVIVCRIQNGMVVNL